MNHTANYNLNQWDAEDKVQRVDFNADNAKIDAAIKTVDSRVDGLSSTVSGKASASSVSSLQSTVNTLSGILPKKGNCQAYYATYQGNGGYGPSQPRSLTFAHKPLAVLVTGPAGYQGIFTYGSPNHYVGRFGNGGNYVTLNWGAKSVSWYNESSAQVQMNQSGETYYVVALLQIE